MSLAHVVVTRFNLEVGYAPGRPTLDPGWLRERLAPLAAICQPSMAAQRAPHRWLVAVDSRTPAPILDELGALPGLELAPLDPPHAFEDLGRAVAAVLGDASAGHLLTTRLDSDDALAEGHLARLQAAFVAAPEPYFLNFPFGHMWHAGRLYGCVDRASPFMSYVEPLGPAPPLTAYRIAHVWSARVAPVRQLWAPSMWIRFIDAHNTSSVVDGVRSPRRRPPRGLRGHPAFARVDGTDRYRDLVRGAPRYVRAHGGLRGLLGRR